MASCARRDCSVLDSERSKQRPGIEVSFSDDFGIAVSRICVTMPGHQHDEYDVEATRHIRSICCAVRTGEIINLRLAREGALSTPICQGVRVTRKPADAASGEFHRLASGNRIPRRLSWNALCKKLPFARPSLGSRGRALGLLPIPGRPFGTGGEVIEKRFIDASPP